MILDSIDHADLYLGLGDNLAEALRFVLSNDLLKYPAGTHNLPGKNFYLLAQSYETKPLEKGVWESHRRYIDIQYMIQGIERVGFAPLQKMTPGEYNPERDLIYLTGKGDFLTLEAGFFVIFFPQDVHMPGLRLEDEQPIQVHKMVIKVAV